MSQSKGKRIPAVSHKAMISEITWSQYLLSAGVLLGLYYLAVLGRYYRQEVKQLLSGKAGAPLECPPPGEEEDHFLSYEELKEVVSQLHHGIHEEAGKHASRQDLLIRIQAILANYGGLRQPASRDAINRYILRQAEEQCGVVLGEAELEAVWDALPTT